MQKKVITIILDGFGYSEDSYWNAIMQANSPYLDSLWNDHPTLLIESSWNACGLPQWEMWTSESGHITIWAWRIIWQPLEEINQSIKSWDFFNNKLLLNSINKWKDLHLIWMLSDGWVHSHINHLFALLKKAKEQWVKQVYIHCIADWRDVEMASLEKYLNNLQKEIDKKWIWKISDIIWRFYAMDRDNNWERIDKAFDLYTKWQWNNCESIKKAMDIAYKKEKNDYYIDPISLPDFNKVKKEDDIIFFNFRSDRAIQLTKRFHENWYKNLLAFGPYTENYPVLYKPKKVINNISSILSKNNKTQLRIAETEKYPHITFYLNSQDHHKQKWEEHILIPSPKVASYAEKPEMSAFEITKKLITEIKKNKHDCIFVNFANADLVWHSWELNAWIKAIETLDKCLSEIIPIANKNDYDVIITADHWNAEQMKTSSWNDSATHTINPVRFTFISNEDQKLKISNNFGLKDVAPTILDIMWIDKPKEMTWESLIKK